MKSIRIGNDIRIVWPIVLSGDVSKLKDLDLTVEVRPSKKIVDVRNYADSEINKVDSFKKTETTILMNGGVVCRPDNGSGKECCDVRPLYDNPQTAPVKLPYTIENNTLIAIWPANKQFATGDYDIVLYGRKNKGGQTVCDQYRFVRLVSHTAQIDNEDNCGVEPVITMQPTTVELSGLSAYEVAVLEGFSGTREEWVESLKQPAKDAANEAEENFKTYQLETDKKVSEFVNRKVTPEMLSESTKQLIEASGGGTITNLADDEDIESVNDGTGTNVLKFKDRAYSPSTFSGKGYKILRKNIVDGKNVLTQSMINEPNTRYVVQYDFDLNGQTIEIKNTSILDFQGGTLRNGTLIANTILGNGNTVYCSIETVYHNYFIENLVIDCEYNYDYALVVNASIYGKITNVRCLKYNRYGIYIKEDVYECIINNFECLSRQNLTNYKYNCGIYCNSTDCVFTSGMIKHNYCGIVLAKGGCNLTNIHIWGEAPAAEDGDYNFENTTKVGILLKSSNNLLNNIYFDSIIYDFNNDDGKKGYELLDENIDYSYKGGVALIFDGTNGCVANILSNIKFFISGKINTENKKKIYCITQIGSGARNNIIANVVLDDTFIVNKNFYLYNDEINDYNKSLPYVTNIKALYNIINNVATRLKFANTTDIVRYKDSYGGLITETWHSYDDETISSFYDRDMYNGRTRIVKAIRDNNIQLSLRDKNGDEFYNEIITPEKKSISVPLEFNFIPKHLSNIDLNTITENGFYKFDDTCTNKPNNNRSDAVAASLLVINTGGTGVTQMVIYDEIIALRTFYPSTQTYGKWYYMFNNANEGMTNMPKNPIIGQTYINSILNQYSIYTKDWYDIKLIKHDAKTYGNTEDRPSLDNNRTDIGYQYFDTDLHKPIYWTGSKWVDATGADV